MHGDARFQFDEDAKVFLERELGLERANAIMGREVKLWRWGHRWYRPLEREEVTVEVTPRGEIASFQHLLPEDGRGADLSAEAARSLAESFLVLEMRHSIVALEYLDSSGVRLLFRLAERVRAGGRELRVVVPRDGYLRRVLAVAGLDQTIPLDGSVDQALTNLA